MGQPISLETLRLQLAEDVKLYSDNRNLKKGREQLLHTLQSNDCREIITTVVDGDELANVFLLAGYRNHVDVLEAFLHHGMNIDTRDNSGLTALIGASLNGLEKCVRFLLDHHTSVDIQDSGGFTALMRASYRGNTKIVEILLEKNANPDLQNKDGTTALMYASANANKEIVRLLLNHSADIELKNIDGKTALDLAKTEEIKEVIRNHVSTSFVLK